MAGAVCVKFGLACGRDCAILKANLGIREVFEIMKVLFQGDSITDAGRDYADPHHLGDGYPKYAAEAIRERFPDETFEFINLGISGNRTTDLLERWQKDCIAVQPDVLSILIGINDTWRRYDSNLPMTVEEYETNYRRLVQDVKENTKAKLLLLEPFLLHADPAKECFREDLDPKILAARRVARDYADMFLPLDGLLAAASVIEEPSHWSGDGVHPNEAGSRLIGRYYAEAFAAMLGK